MQQQHLPPSGGLARYGSAPGKFLAAIAESVVGEYSSPAPAAAAGSEAMMSRLYSAHSSCLTAESTCKSATASASKDLNLYHGNDLGATAAGGEIPKGGGDFGQQHPLLRHSSSPAHFFSHLMLDDGYAHTNGIGFCQQAADSFHSTGSRRLKSQLSFSRQDSLSQMSEISIPEIGEDIGNTTTLDDAAIQSYMSNDFPGSWDDTNSILFSAPRSKRAKMNNGDMISNFSNIDTQFSLPKTPQEMEKLFQMHQDAVPFKIRAKRGCATHPRSIAERERRTRISEKLRKLQELVPNMNEQTNTADMLDLAVQHIKVLQSQVQKLKEEQANCICEARNR